MSRRRTRSEDVAIALMDDIMAWLRANDIEPTDVPLWAVPTIADGMITCPVYLRRDGRKYLVNIGRPDEDVAQGSVTVPLKQEPPEKLRVWLDLAEEQQP